MTVNYAVDVFWMTEFCGQEGRLLSNGQHWYQKAQVN